jgi:predicted nucleic acid-binding protein
MGIILDSGFLYSLKIIKAKKYSRAIKILQETKWKEFGSIITTNLVINELYTLVNARTKCNPDALKKIDELIWGKENFFKILFLNKQDYPEIAKLMIKYSNPNTIISFVDASLIYIGKKLKYHSIVSFDHHFDGILSRIS